MGFINIESELLRFRLFLALQYKYITNISVCQVTTYLPDIELLKERKINPVRNLSQLWTPLAVGLNRVRHGGHAYQCEASHAYAYIRKTFDAPEMCDLNEIYMRPPMPLAYLSNKRSPYLELLRCKFGKYRETGITSKYNRIWQPKKPACSVGSYVFSVGMEYVAPLFLFLAASMVGSAVVLAVEWTEYRWTMRWYRP